MSLGCESVWFDQHRYESVESRYQAILANRLLGLKVEGRSIVSQNPISSEIEKAMDLIGKSLKSNMSSSVNTTELEKRVTKLEEENVQLKLTIQDILARLNASGGQKTLNKNEGDDSDFDLFGSDVEEPSKVQRDPPKLITKSKKPQPVAKSSLVLDVKPWDDETAKILPVAYGIKKLQISCVIEDDKIGTDFLEESITAFDELVQSVDIVAFNKI